VKEQIEAVTLEGRMLRVTAREPLPVEPRVIALATAIRVFDRYPILERLTLTTGSAEISLSREEIERLLGRDGFASLREWGRWRQILATAVQAYTGAKTP
jgi:hypothetical protein